MLDNMSCRLSLSYYLSFLRNLFTLSFAFIEMKGKQKSQGVFLLNFFAKIFLNNAHNLLALHFFLLLFYLK